MASVTVAELGAGDLPAATDVLVDAFADDPLLVFLLGPSPRRALRIALGELARDALGPGEVVGARVGGELAGVAVWLGPGAHPPSLARQLRHLPAWARLAVLVGRRAPVVLRATSALDRLHPPEPHRFLSLLATRRASRGLGVASALVRPGLERAAAEGVRVHLDTSRPENVAIYERFGFQVASRAPTVPGAPPTWAMRTPQPAAAAMSR
jgi:ribosomal protein S18 acetylase RimI-like enzyme